MNANATTGNDELLKVYWQPGCSSCLRTKEFLTKHGVPFVSINVLTDREAFDDLARLGVRRVPIVRRGGDWVDGQILKDLGYALAEVAQALVTFFGLAQDALHGVGEVARVLVDGEEDGYERHGR